MNIEWMIPCRYLEVHDGLGTIIGAGIDTFLVDETPAIIQLVVALRLVATAEELEAGGTHVFATRVRHPSGEILSELRDEEMTIGEAVVSRPDWLVPTIVPITLRFEASEEGSYAIEVDVDDASKAVPVHVAVGQA